MQRTQVESSNLVSVGYDDKTFTLEVEFKHGGVYQYENVPADVHAALLAAPSVGSYFSAKVKNTYPFTKVS